MSKYAFLGLFFTMLIVIMGGLMINHNSSTYSMQEVDVGLESAAMGVIRESDGDNYGVNARDLIAELTTVIAEKQTETNREIEISYVLFDKNDVVIADFDNAVANNTMVSGVQYKVDLYKTDSSSIKNGKRVILDGRTPQSSTENKISLNHK